MIVEMCHIKTHCNLNASDDIFGDPCRSILFLISKILEVTYICEDEATGDECKSLHLIE